MNTESSEKAITPDLKAYIPLLNSSHLDVVVIGGGISVERLNSKLH